MICRHCIHYNSRLKECALGVEIIDGLEAIDCIDYLYNGEVDD